MLYSLNEWNKIQMKMKEISCIFNMTSDGFGFKLDVQRIP